MSLFKTDLILLSESVLHYFIIKPVVTVLDWILCFKQGKFVQMFNNFCLVYNTILLFFSVIVNLFEMCPSTPQPNNKLIETQ